MKNEVTMRMNSQKVNEAVSVFSAIMTILMQPFEWLRGYYSACLNKDINMRQTFHLLHVQIAFVFAVFPVACPLLLRFVFIAWFVATLVSTNLGSE